MLGQKEFCQGGRDHLSSLRFCGQCAEDKKSYKTIFCCQRCSKQQIRKHKQHLNCIKIDSPEFKEIFKCFSSEFKQNYSEQEDKNIRKLCERNLDYGHFMDKEFRKWICQHKFWEFSSTKSEIAKSTLKSKISHSSSPDVISEKDIKVQQCDIFDWSMLEENGDNIFETLRRGAENQAKKLTESERILDLLLKLDLYEIHDQNNNSQTEKEIDHLIQKMNDCYNGEGPTSEWWDSFQALKQRAQDQTGFLEFLFALQYWRKRKPDQLKRNNILYFKNEQTNEFFVLKSPKRFIEEMNEILYKIEAKNSYPVYLGRAFGHLCLNNKEQAEDDIKKAIEFLNLYPKRAPFCEIMRRMILSKKPQIISVINQSSIKTKKTENSFVFNSIFNSKTSIVSGQRSYKPVQRQNIVCEIADELLEKFEIMLRHGIDKDILDRARFCNQIEEKQTDPIMMYNIAMALYEEKKYEQAQTWIKLGLGKQKQNQQFLSLYLCILVRMRHLSEAKRIAKQIDIGQIRPEMAQLIELI